MISGDVGEFIKMWDWQNQVHIIDFIGHTDEIYCSLQNKLGTILVTGSKDCKAIVWDIGTSKQLKNLETLQSSIFRIALTNDENTLIAGGSDENIKIFDFNTLKLQSTHGSKAGAIQCLTITTDNAYLIYGTRSHIVKVLTWPKKLEYFIFNSHENWVRNIVTIIDCKYFISASADRTVRIVNLSTRQEDHVFAKNDGYVFGLFLRKSGTTLASGASDKIVKFGKSGQFIRSIRFLATKNALCPLLLLQIISLS